jgi:hypothetical protein
MDHVSKVENAKRVRIYDSDGGSYAGLIDITKSWSFGQECYHMWINKESPTSVRLYFNKECFEDLVEALTALKHAKVFGD